MTMRLIILKTRTEEWKIGVSFPPSSYASRFQPIDQGVIENKNKNTVVDFFSYDRRY